MHPKKYEIEWRKTENSFGDYCYFVVIENADRPQVVWKSRSVLACSIEYFDEVSKADAIRRQFENNSQLVDMAILVDEASGVNDG